MKFKKSESGRSMVEMLGVLAIIGVLSVGGIAGYSLSMRRHRANQVVDLMSKYAVLLYGRCQKLILDGKVEEQWLCATPASIKFEDTGIGNLPSGIKVLFSQGYDVVPHFPDGTDIVAFSAHFDDDKLCQTVGSIIGTGCHSKHTVFFKFKQN